MLRSVKDLEGYDIGGTDGEIGHVKDFYFDDRAWVVRYLVIDAGTWLSSRKVLISPIAIGRPDWTERLLHVWLTKDQVKNSPAIDTDKPVSRQHEMAYSSYYGYPNYWGGDGYWADGLYPNLMSPEEAHLGSRRATSRESENAYALADIERSEHEGEDPNLRSCREVMKYHIHATDGGIGHVDDVLLDDQTWAIRYLIVNTSNWWLGHQLLVAPQWIDHVSWFDSKVFLKMTRQAIKWAPAYDPVAQLERVDEAALYEHYGQRGYWSVDPLLETESSRV
ncbi:MAG: PRC-barrel domain-containing protein [Caldimonas sp.]